MPQSESSYTEGEAKAALRAAGYNVDQCENGCCDWRHIPKDEVLRLVRKWREDGGEEADE